MQSYSLFRYVYESLKQQKGQNVKKWKSKSVKKDKIGCKTYFFAKFLPKKEQRIKKLYIFAASIKITT